MVNTNGVLIVNVLWANTPAMKRAAEVIERRADFITTVTRAEGTSRGKSVFPSWESKQRRPDEGFIWYDEFVIYFNYAKLEKINTAASRRWRRHKQFHLPSPLSAAP